MHHVATRVFARIRADNFGSHALLLRLLGGLGPLRELLLGKNLRPLNARRVRHAWRRAHGLQVHLGARARAVRNLSMKHGDQLGVGALHAHVRTLPLVRQQVVQLVGRVHLRDFLEPRLPCGHPYHPSCDDI